ncbi:SDR family NAD(P)-dependent oxidoreductase [Streptomyces sp. NPDC000345]|uniref:SDR family NAD(P)-dependent oxidoreductase n=1 Tax=Streptomyces sp. NPDC000345 TaxID=3364537 RepID=UPI0036C1BE75
MATSSGIPDVQPVAPIPFPLLRGQKALVTGANSGIGRATAVALGRVGADVVVNYVAGRDAAEDVVREIEGFGVRAYAHEADVSQEDQVVDMVARMVEEFGTIDVMVANAGLQRDAAITDMTLDQWHKVLDVNLTGQFLCAREATKELKSSSSVSSRTPVRPSSSAPAPVAAANSSPGARSRPEAVILSRQQDQRRDAQPARQHLRAHRQDDDQGQAGEHLVGRHRGCALGDSADWARPG